MHVIYEDRGLMHVLSTFSNKEMANNYIIYIKLCSDANFLRITYKDGPMLTFHHGSCGRFESLYVHDKVQPLRHQAGVCTFDRYIINFWYVWN